MALVLKDRVKETTTTTGTGTVTLAGAAAGFQSFVVIGDGNQTFYAIVDATSGAWEVGVGTYTSSGTTLSRTTVVSSSNAGSLVNFGAGSKDVFVTYPSSRAVYLDAAGSAVTTLDIGTLGTSTANISTANITAGTVATAPVNNTDIVNKQYADAIASGIHFHEAVNLATTAALPANTYNNGTSGVGATLTGNANGALSVDSTLTTVSERILVKNEAAGANNGVYTVTQVGSAGTPYILTRATDFDSVGTGVNEIDEGDFFLVTSGTANLNTAWVQQTPPPITIGTTALVFQQFAAPITYTAGTGLNESPTYTFNIANIGTAGTYGSASSVPVITTNAQGQVTGVTNTAIAISGAAVSGNISGSAGSVANALTAGSFLTSGGTFDGSAARTFAVDATDVNTASKVVARDASGNFSAGTITATLSGAATSATTATNLAGGAANRIAYQTGAGATTFAVAPTASNQVLNWNGSAFTWSAGTISGVALGSNLSTLTFGTYLTGTSYNGSTAVTLATNATNANTASTLVARDASGNFSAGTITAALSGTATTATNQSGGTVSATTGAFTSTLTSNFGLANADNALRIFAPGGASYATGASTVTGAIKIRIPAAALGSNTMLSFKVKVYQYSTGLSNEFQIGGYNYSDAGKSWINVSATALSQSQGALTVRFGFDGTSQCVYIGELASSWSYPQVVVTDFIGGYSSYTTALWASGWSVTFESSAFAGVTASATAAATLNSSNYTSYAPSLTGSGASGTWGINVTGNAATATTATTATNQSGGTVSATTGSFSGAVTTGSVYSRSAAGQGWLNGNYSSVETANTSGAIYSIGTAYPPGATSLGTMYGVGFTVGNGTANPGLGMTGWGFYAASGGVSRVFLDSDSGIVISSGSTRSPIFYDRDNTGYYLDPTSSQSLRTVGDWRSDATSWTGEFSGKIQYHSSIWYLQAATGHQFRNSGGSQTMFVDSAGNLTATANITAYSDARLKENVVTVDNALDKATALRGVYYNKIGDPKRRVGVIAQEIQEVLPEVVLTITEKNPATGEESEMLAVDYGNIVGLLIEAVKELRAEVEKLKGGQ